MKTVPMEKAKALLIITLLLATFLVGSEAGRELMKPKEEVYNPNWLWGWNFGHGIFWPWWWWGLHGVKDAPHGGNAGKGDMPYDHDKGNGNGEKGESTPGHGGDGQKGDGGNYP